VSQASTQHTGRERHPRSSRSCSPYADLNNLSNTEGFAGDPEDTEQVDAKNQPVREADQRRRRDQRAQESTPTIVSIDPTNDAEMRAQCKGLDGRHAGGLCRCRRPRDMVGRQPAVHHTRRGQKPVHRGVDDGPDLDQDGCALLWWTGPDQASVLAALVSWGESARPAEPLHQSGRGQQQPSPTTPWRSTTTSSPIWPSSASRRWSRPWTPTPPTRRRRPARHRWSCNG